MLNLKAKTSHVMFDSYGMAVVKGDERSWKDSIGRTVLAWIAYGMPYELHAALAKCFTLNKKGKFGLYRHPAHKEKSSRDHWSYAIVLRILYDKEFNVNFISTQEWLNRIPRMRGMNLWMKSLTGNKRAEWWYYVINIPGARLGNWWLRKCRKWGRIWPEEDNRVWLGSHPTRPGVPGYLILSERTPWQKLWAWIIFTSMPAYALHNKAWQIYVMRKTPKRDTLRKILLKRVGKSNIMLRLLLEPEVIYNSDYLKSSYKLVTQEEVDNYPNMTGYRPGVYLDETCRRDIRELTDKEAEFNTYEKSLIIWLYNKHTS